MRIQTLTGILNYKTFLTETQRQKRERELNEDCFCGYHFSAGSLNVFRCETNEIISNYIYFFLDTVESEKKTA